MINTKAPNLIPLEAYLTNTLINLQGLLQTFYDINLFLEH